MSTQEFMWPEFFFEGKIFKLEICHYVFLTFQEVLAYLKLLFEIEHNS